MINSKLPEIPRYTDNLGDVVNYLYRLVREIELKFNETDTAINNRNTIFVLESNLAGFEYLDFPVPKEVSSISLRLINLRPENNGDNLVIEFSADNGATFISGAIDGTDGTTPFSNQNSFVCASSVDNSGQENELNGHISITRPGFPENTGIEALCYHGSSGSPVRRSTQGILTTNDEVNYIRIRFSSGDIVKGTVVIEGSRR